MYLYASVRTRGSPTTTGTKYVLAAAFTTVGVPAPQIVL